MASSSDREEKKATNRPMEPDLASMMSRKKAEPEADDGVEIEADSADAVPDQQIIQLLKDVTNTSLDDCFESMSDRFFVAADPKEQKELGKRLTQALTDFKIANGDPLEDITLPNLFIQNLIKFCTSKRINRGTLREGVEVMSEPVQMQTLNEYVTLIRYNLLHPTLEFFKDPGDVLQQQLDSGKAKELMATNPDDLFDGYPGDDKNAELMQVCYAQLSDSLKPASKTPAEYAVWDRAVGRLGLNLNAFNKYVEKVIKPLHPEWDVDDLFKPQHASVIKVKALNNYCGMKMQQMIEQGNAGEVIKSDVVTDSKNFYCKFECGVVPAPIGAAKPKLPVEIFLLDVSASMNDRSGEYKSPSKLAKLQESLRALINEYRRLKMEIEVAFVTFSHEGKVILHKQSVIHSGSGPDTLMDAVNNMTAKGGTIFPAAFDLAVSEILPECKDNDSVRITSLTDGASAWAYEEKVMPAELKGCIEKRSSDGYAVVSQKDYMTKIAIPRMQAFQRQHPQLPIAFRVGFINGTPADGAQMEAFAEALKTANVKTSKADVRVIKAADTGTYILENKLTPPPVKVPVTFEVTGEPKIELKEAEVGTEFKLSREVTPEQLEKGVKLTLGGHASKTRTIRDAHPADTLQQIADKELADVNAFLAKAGIQRYHSSVEANQKAITAKIAEYQQSGMKFALAELRKFEMTKPLSYDWMQLNGDYPLQTESHAKRARYRTGGLQTQNAAQPKPTATVTATMDKKIEGPEVKKTAVRRTGDWIAEVKAAIISLPSLFTPKAKKKATVKAPVSFLFTKAQAAPQLQQAEVKGKEEKRVDPTLKKNAERRRYRFS